MKTCNKCGINKKINLFEKGRKTCKQCRKESRRIHSITCGYCRKTFKSAKKNAKYCSSQCAGEARVETVKVVCEYCGREKEVIPSLRRKINNHYCNQACRTEHLRIIINGDNNPNYNREKYNCDGCGKEFKIIPSRLEKQRYSFCSYECYQKNIGQYFTGENGNNWNHKLTSKERNDLRRYPEYYKWRSSVYERDEYTCKNCGDNKGGNLIAHHIYNYSEHKKLRTVLSNGITLCETCHMIYHKQYGYKNNNEKQLNEFINKRKAL